MTSYNESSISQVPDPQEQAELLRISQALEAALPDRGFILIYEGEAEARTKIMSNMVNWQEIINHSYREVGNA